MIKAGLSFHDKAKIKKFHAAGNSPEAIARGGRYQLKHVLRVIAKTEAPEKPKKAAKPAEKKVADKD